MLAACSPTYLKPATRALQAVLLLQRAFRARRNWAAEMAKLRALLGFERASVRGQRKQSGPPTLVERREAASIIQAAVRTLTLTLTLTLT